MADDFNRTINQGADRLIQSIRDIRTTTAIREANAAADEIKAGAESDAIKESQLRQVANALTNQLAQTGAINPAAAVGAIAPKTPFFQTAEQAFINQGTAAERGQRAEEFIGLQQAQARAAEARQEARESRGRNIPGFGLAATKEDASRVRKSLGQVRSADKKIDELIGLLDQPVNRISPSQRAKSKALLASVRGALRLPLIGPGAMSDQERKILEEAVADPTAIFQIPSATRSALTTLKSAMATGIREEAIAAGVEGLEQQARGEVTGVRRANTSDFSSIPGLRRR